MKKVMSILVILGALTLGANAQAGLIAFYDFEGDAADRSGNGHDGTVFGATLTTGVSGQGYSFDGSNDYIRVDLDVNPGVLPQMTWGAWVNSDTTSGIRKVLSHDNAGFDRTIGMDTRTGGTWSTFTGSGVSGVYTINPGTWQFIAGVYDETINQTLLYVDGGATVFASSFGPGHAFLRIGSNPSFVEYFDGIIDEVFIYDEALTITELNDIRRDGIDVGGGSNTVPEPATMFLFGTGLAGAFIVAKKPWA